jgi:5,10-methylene-tetrahydrofolate dehydrogenase/methenyl tetrahydrofolate cyclohydrolase
MNDCDLGIYYDNPNEASDMYLKWLLKDCEKNNIQVKVFDNLSTFWKESSNFKASLFLEPIQDKHAKTLQDCINNNVDKPSATAQGIYDYITKHYPDRITAIAVMGRGLVGRQLIDKLIDYGYTVCEFNSKSYTYDKLDFCIGIADVVVGLATEQIFDKHDCNSILDSGAIFIDAANNFDTKNKLRCGKWTRQIIINRIKKLKGEEV